jgi:hypothetical protein
MRDLEFNLFLNFGSHLGSLEMPDAMILSSRLARVQRNAGFQRDR